MTYTSIITLSSSENQAFPKPAGRYVCPARRTGASKQALSSPVPSLPIPSPPVSPSSTYPSTARSSPTSTVPTPPSLVRNWRSRSQLIEPSPPPQGSSQGTKPVQASLPPGGRAQKSANWRNSAPAQVLPPIGPQAANVHPGQVYKLPRESDVSPDSIFHRRMATRSDSPWEHPLVVLEVQPSGIVKCRLLGSLGGQRLQNRRAHEQQKIALCENEEGVQAHVGTRILTVAPGSEMFPRATYCNFHDDDGTDGVFHIEVSNLHSWTTKSGSPITLSRESVERIKNKQVY